MAKNSTLKTLFLQEYHDSPIEGHTGILKTFKCIQQDVFWEGLKKDVADYVSTCHTCQQTQYVPQSPLELLQPLPIPAAV